MSIDLHVYGHRRLVPVRFTRATTGDPHPAYPDIDDRGPQREGGPVVGVTAGDTIWVRLVREHIDTSAKLFAVSSSEALFSVLNVQELPAVKEIDIWLQAHQGGDPARGKLHIRHGDPKNGPVLHSLNVRVYEKLVLRLTPHQVFIASNSIADGGIGAIPGSIDVHALMAQVKAIWRPCGIDFDVQLTRPDYHTFAAAGAVQTMIEDAGAEGGQRWGPEVVALLSEYHVRDTVNVYCVNRIIDVEDGGVLGTGFSRTRADSYGLPHPGILIGDQTSGFVGIGDSMSQARILAHEIGHFLNLAHPENRARDHLRQDTWSRRMLMQPGQPKTYGDWRDQAVGYGMDGGEPRRGCFLTMKNLPRLDTDEEVTRARKTIHDGPY